MDAGASQNALVSGIVDAVRYGKANHKDAVCVIVFASSTPDASLGADVGRGFFSIDGKGLDGEGNGLIAQDHGDIQVDVHGSDVIYVSP